MNYIALVNRFWQCDMEHSFTESDTRLYFYLLHTCNSLGWKNPFGHSDRHLALRLGMSVNTARTAKNRLKQRGMIDFSSPANGSKGVDGQTKYTILTVSNFDTDTATVVDTVPDTVPDTDTATNNKLNKTKHEVKEKDEAIASLQEQVSFLQASLKEEKEKKPNPLSAAPPSKPAKIYVPPTHEEVKQYFIEKTGVNGQISDDFAETFIAHYINTGWTYGKAKHKITDWKAAFRSSWDTSKFINDRKNKSGYSRQTTISAVHNILNKEYNESDNSY